MRSVLRIALLLAISSLAATGWVSYRGLKWIPDAQSILARKAEIASVRKDRGISLEKFKEMIAQGAIVIDARPRSEFVKSHLAIESYPPVLNIEPNDVQNNQGRLETLLQLGQPIVLYCTSSECDLAEELYANLNAMDASFADAVIYVPGWDGILKAKLPVTSGPDTFTAAVDSADPADGSAASQAQGEPDGGADTTNP